MELLIGCGNKREKLVASAATGLRWSELVTLDNDPDCRPDVEWDLERLPLPFDDEKFDEIHAYHVLEHVGRQGDYRTFFAQFGEFYRMLKPDGLLCGAVPAPGSRWVFGDPGHTRFLPPEVFMYLDQDIYKQQVGVTALADYRRFWRGDFVTAWKNVIDEGTEGQFFFALRAIKPSRIA